jgi:hypothetical protein
MSDTTQIYASTAGPDFVPAPDNHVVEIRGSQANVRGFTDGTEFTPGETYYVKQIDRDVLGNMSLPTEAQSMVVRSTTKSVGAHAFALNSGSSVLFWGSVGDVGLKWWIYPFSNDSSSPAFDSGGFYTTSTLTTGSAPFLTSIPSHSFFRSAFDGEVQCTARLGVRNDRDFNGGRTTAFVNFGLFRLGSTLPGSNASTPVKQFTFGNSESGGVTPTYLMVGHTVGDSGAVSSLFVTLEGIASVHSGDYLCWGVRAGGTNADLFTLEAPTTASTAAAWCKFTVLRQD